MYGINYNGLKRRQTYEEIIDYLQYGQERIKYPNRAATQLRNSPELTNLLDGEGLNIKNIEQQQRDKSIMEIREHLIRDIASRNNETAQHLRIGNPTGPQQFNIGSATNAEDDDIIEEYDNLDEIENNNSQIANIASNMLTGTAAVAGTTLALAGALGAAGVAGTAAGLYGLYKGGEIATNFLVGNNDDGESTRAPTSGEVLTIGDGSTATAAIMDGSVEGTGASSSNDDLNAASVDLLRTMIRRHDYQSIGVTSREISSGRKTFLTDVLRRLRG